MTILRREDEAGWRRVTYSIGSPLAGAILALIALDFIWERLTNDPAPLWFIVVIGIAGATSGYLLYRRLASTRTS